MENEQLMAVMIFSSILAPFVTALTQLMKTTFKLRKNFIPFYAFLIGLLIGYISFPFTELDLVMRLWAGGIAGLTSVGLFEAMKDRKGYSKE